MSGVGPNPSLKNRMVFRLSPSDLSPQYWINMGAMAISTLAGSLLIANAPDAPFLASLTPFLKGFTVFYWATGTWWIPMLVVLVVWRHVYARHPLQYDLCTGARCFRSGCTLPAPSKWRARLGWTSFTRFRAISYTWRSLPGRLPSPGSSARSFERS